MKKQEDMLTEEISTIIYNFNGVSWEDAWGMSCETRSIVVNTLNMIIKKKNDALKKGQ